MQWRGYLTLDLLFGCRGSVFYDMAGQNPNTIELKYFSLTNMIALMIV